MKAILITVGAKLPLIVVPDSRAHVDGHPVLTYTYSLYRDKGTGPNQAARKEGALHLEKKDDPDYMGEITFEEPDRLFSYTSGGGKGLSSDQVQQAIEQITHYRENPALWKI